MDYGYLEKVHYTQQSPWKEMQSTTHPNEWVQYTSQPQFVVQSRRNQSRAKISIVPDQSQEISSPKLVKS
jgi:hypothetical protein